MDFDYKFKYNSIIRSLEVLRSNKLLIHASPSKESFEHWLSLLNDFSGETYIGIDVSDEHKYNDNCLFYRIKKKEI